MSTPPTVPQEETESHFEPAGAGAAAGPITSAFARPKRIDLHCHSIASTEADEAVLNALRCPECFSSPADVYAQAKRRGMDFVTITDHDSLDGVRQLAGRPGVLNGEEVTCYFPEDRCKMHVLVWGITAADHDALQARANGIYEVAAYIARHSIAHAVAHALYRQNDRLERWHLERLLLMFKGFEALNGAHSQLHGEALAPVLDGLTPARIAELAARHGMSPLWPEPWRKACTGGSDDHGLFNIGRTWTEFPGGVQTTDEVLQCLREGCCRPGGEYGSSLKLAHNFYGVGIRHYLRNIAPPAPGKATTKTRATPLAPRAILETLVGERAAPRRRDLFKLAVSRGARAVGRKVMRPFARRRQAASSGTALLGDLFVRSFAARGAECRSLAEALRRGDAPLGEHEAMFRLVSALNRDVTAGIAQSVRDALGNGERRRCSMRSRPSPRSSSSCCRTTSPSSIRTASGVISRASPAMGATCPLTY